MSCKTLLLIHEHDTKHLSPTICTYQVSVLKDQLYIHINSIIHYTIALRYCYVLHTSFEIFGENDKRHVHALIQAYNIGRLYRDLHCTEVMVRKQTDRLKIHGFYNEFFHFIFYLFDIITSCCYTHLSIIFNPSLFHNINTIVYYYAFIQVYR